MLRISKDEMLFLVKNGAKFGPDITHTTARHRRTYYMTESQKNMAMLNEYRNSKITK